MNRENDGCRSSVGCASLPTVLFFGLAFTFFGISIGGGCSARIPFTESNISLAGSVGKKETANQALPNYLRERVASNRDFLNSSNTLTLWVAEGIGIAVIGEQADAPQVDLNINLAR